MPGKISARREVRNLPSAAMAGFNPCIGRKATQGFCTTAEGLELFCLSEGLQDLCNSLHHVLEGGRTNARKPTYPCCSRSLHQWRCGLQDVNKRVPKPGWLGRVRGIVPKMLLFRAFRGFISSNDAFHFARILPHVVLQRSGRAKQSYGINKVRLHHFVPGESCHHDGYPDVFAIFVIFMFLCILPRLLLQGLGAKDGGRERHLDFFESSSFFALSVFKTSFLCVWLG